MDKNTIPNVKEFTLTFSRPQSFQRDEMVYNLVEKYTTIPRVRVMTVPLEGINRAIYMDSVGLKHLFDYLFGILASPQGFKKHLKEYKKTVKAFKKVGKEVAKIGSDKGALLAGYVKAMETMKLMSDYAWAPMPVEKVMVPKFLDLLRAENPATADEINHAISSPVKLYEYQNMRLDMCDTIIKGKTGSEKAIAKLVKNYHWWGEYSGVEPLFDEAYFKTELAKMSVQTATDEKARIYAELKHAKKSLKTALKQIKDKTALHYARAINEYTYLRTDRVDLLKKIQVPMRNIYDKTAQYLARETGKPWTRIEVVKLLMVEIVDYLSGKSTPNFDEVIKRGEAVYYRTSDDLRVLTDKAAVQKVKDELNTGLDKKIKGMIAFKGTAKGVVKMVFSKNDLPKVLPGDILVARTTMPDYTPAMEIASAFVTEEGGVTSHAAIIARELRKPCIVGTGNCTKVLKDGDMVEVDAVKGTVTVL